MNHLLLSLMLVIDRVHQYASHSFSAPSVSIYGKRRFSFGKQTGDLAMIRGGATTKIPFCEDRSTKISLLSTAQRGGAETRTEPMQEKGATSMKPLQFFLLEGGMCPYAGRTWIVLLELGLPFEKVELSRATGKPDWFLEINPRGKVPALVDPNTSSNKKDKIVVYESAICNEYLSDLAQSIDPSPSSAAASSIWKLMPTDPAQRAHLRLLNDHYDTQIGPAQFTFLMNKDPAKTEQLRTDLEKALDVLESQIEDGPFFLGESFTVADAHAVPFVHRLVVSLAHFQKYELSKERYPKLLTWYEACMERPSVREASPTKERILEVYQKFMDMNYSFGGLNKNEDK